MLQWIPTVLIILIHILMDSMFMSEITVRRETNEIRNTVGFLPAASPTNLTATVSTFDASRKLLQMNITWSPAKDGHPATSYNLHIRSLNDSDPHCASEPYYAFIEDANCAEWVVSPKPLASGIHESGAPPIVPDCYYRIRLEANPHDGKTSTEIDFQVPDCVEGVCNCRHASALPKPDLHVEHANKHTVNITWFLRENQNVSSFLLRVGPSVIGGTHSAVYNLSWSRHVPISNERVYHESYMSSDVGRHAAVVQTVDSRGCLGREEQLVFTIEGVLDKSKTENARKEIFWMALMTAGLFITIICLLLILFGRKYFHIFQVKQHKTHFASCGFFYKAINMKSARVFRRNTSIREWNVLYVEKEIEDAKERGEADSFEISYNRLTIEREIGRGAFGQVFLARAESIRGVPGSRLVAVKKLKGTAGSEEKEEFLEEISMLKKVGQHPNIVTLFACCTLNSDLCMVMEYVPCGDLLKYLRNLRQKLDARKPSITSMSDGMYSTPSTVLTSLNSHTYSSPQLEECPDLDYVLNHRELHNFALQIARGMAHLEAKSITHRDLAARNILINDNKVLKISDFGLSRRGVYINTRRRKVPLRWLSIEAMRDSLYSSKSDVWAFAILLWEIGTLGGFPYPTVGDFDLLQYLKSGNRLEKPDIVTQDLYSVMLVCWSEMADDRPSFAELVSYLEPKMDHHVYVDFSSNPRLPPTCAYVEMEKRPSSSCK